MSGCLSEILCVCDSINNGVQLYYPDGELNFNFPQLNWPMYSVPATAVSGKR